MQHDYVIESNFDFQCYSLFSLARLRGTNDWLQGTTFWSDLV